MESKNLFVGFMMFHYLQVKCCHPCRNQKWDKSTHRHWNI